MGYGIEGSLVRLAPVDAERLAPLCARWLNDPEVIATLGVGGRPLTIGDERAYFEGALKNDREVIWQIERLADGEPIGVSSIHGIDSIHRTCTTGSFIGPHDARGQGFGSEATALRAQFAFGVLGIRLIRTSYLDGNLASRRMQEKSGAFEIGRWPGRFYKNGEWRDEVLMALTPASFAARPAAGSRSQAVQE